MFLTFRGEAVTNEEHLKPGLVQDGWIIVRKGKLVTVGMGLRITLQIMIHCNRLRHRHHTRSARRQQCPKKFIKTATPEILENTPIGEQHCPRSRMSSQPIANVFRVKPIAVHSCETISVFLHHLLVEVDAMKLIDPREVITQVFKHTGVSHSHLHDPRPRHLTEIHRTPDFINNPAVMGEEQGLEAMAEVIEKLPRNRGIPIVCEEILQQIMVPSGHRRELESVADQTTDRTPVVDERLSSDAGCHPRHQCHQHASNHASGKSRDGKQPYFGVYFH